MCKKMMNADTLYKNSRKVMYVYSVDLKERMKVIETQQNEIQQLDQQKAMWNELKEWLDNDETGFIHEWADQSADTVVTIYEVLKKMQELEGEKDGTKR